ncbi:MAG TPA: ferrous iron transport protein A [Cyanobacteria bacterium UBA11370]|nr:ferrous iron transport protein A [Cyanobacteria bacterium UBA11370]HBY77675.1 ferrous iron transport protein A [Cyanobacteria bacterium UBA11148]
MVELSDVTIGTAGTVAALKTEDETMLRRLTAMGVSPGISITLEQQFPSYIIKVGRTRAALDRETAKTIYITPR